MDTRDAFAGAVRTIIGPSLRRVGFVGSGALWRISAESGAVGIVSVQKSGFGSRDEVTAIFNLGVVAPGSQAPTERVRRRPSLDAAILHARLGAGTPDDPELWWHARSPDEATVITEAMVVRFLEVGLPELQSLFDEATLEAVIDSPYAHPRSVEWHVNPALP